MDYTMPEVAELLGCHLLTVYRYIKAGKLRARKDPDSGAVRIDATAVDDFLAERRAIGAGTLTTQAVARALACDVRTVQRLVTLGKLETRRGPTHALRITQESFARYSSTLDRQAPAQVRRTARALAKSHG